MDHKPFTGRLPNFNLCVKCIFVFTEDACCYVAVCHTDFLTKQVVKHDIGQFII